MKRCLPLVIGCTLLAVSVGRTFGADIDTEKKKLQGTWKSISFEGVGLPKNSKPVTLVFKGDDAEATVGLDSQSYEYDLDVDESPMQIDLIPKLGKNVDPEHTNKGLYRIDDGVLLVCFGGHQRPARFELRSGTVDVLIKLEKQR